MKRFILTGTPGAGKTAILRQLEMDCFGVVEEAATDVIALWQARGIAEPWTDAAFVDAVVELQTQREMRAAMQPDASQFHDRSVVCTAALASYLGYNYSDALQSALDRIVRVRVFEKRAFFIRSLGFVEPSAARRISLEEAMRFETIHEETYRKYGFDIHWIEPASLTERVEAVKRAVRAG